MRIDGRKVLVLGGYGLVGTAVCRELIAQHVGEIQIHSLLEDECEQARVELEPEAGDTKLSTSFGDIFGLEIETDRLGRIGAQLRQLEDEDLEKFRLYRLIVDSQADIVIDCVNTATAIAYSDVYGIAEKVWRQVVAEEPDDGAVEDLLEALYIPRLIRHIQVLYRGLIESDVSVYIKVGTSGTGGMGLNVPYTHSEEKPSRVLLSKSAMAGAHSMLLFLMARTPDAPIIKEISPPRRSPGNGSSTARSCARAKPFDWSKPNPSRWGRPSRRSTRRPAERRTNCSRRSLSTPARTGSSASRSSPC